MRVLQRRSADSIFCFHCQARNSCPGLYNKKMATMEDEYSGLCHKQHFICRYFDSTFSFGICQLVLLLLQNYEQL